MMITCICVAVTMVIFVADLWIKNHVEDVMPQGETRAFWKGRILIRKHHNRGAMLNIGQAKRKFVAGLSVAMTIVAVICFLISLGHKGNTFLRLGLSLLLGGAFSNTYDRLKRKYVVDYFSFGTNWSPLRSIVFNMSDFCIMIGALLAVIGSGKPSN